MDAVYIVRKGACDNLELLFSLRSLKNLPHDRVFIVGYLPRWVRDVVHVPCGDPHKLKALNALHKITTACKDSRISEEFVLMNDDFFVTKPLESLPTLHRGTIAEHAAYRAWRAQVGTYFDCVERTIEAFPDGLDYSLHTPFVYGKSKFLRLAEKFDLGKWYLLRTMYGNEYGIGGEKHEDAKVRNRQELEAVKRDVPPFLSSMDDYFGREYVSFLKELFPEPSEYEAKWLKFRF